MQGVGCRVYDGVDEKEDGHEAEDEVHCLPVCRRVLPGSVAGG